MKTIKLIDYYFEPEVFDILKDYCSTMGEDIPLYNGRSRVKNYQQGDVMVRIWQTRAHINVKVVRY